VLDRQECRALLGRSTVGRVAISVRALPTIVPVDFAVAGECVYFPVEIAGDLERATRDAVVAFEVDGKDDSGALAWSVTICGVARPLRSAAEVERAEGSWRARWPGRAVPHSFVAVPITLVTGHRPVQPNRAIYVEVGGSGRA
jgi:nitroimidazol reductase NimA-like FMN-containing flavoprotein (pyridoxamine 5'-phosphate oxidase superfamily)